MAVETNMWSRSMSKEEHASKRDTQRPQGSHYVDRRLVICQVVLTKSQIIKKIKVADDYSMDAFMMDNIIKLANK